MFTLDVIRMVNSRWMGVECSTHGELTGVYNIIWEASEEETTPKTYA